MTATMLFPLETSIPTAFINIPPTLNSRNRRPSFSHCRLNLLCYMNARLNLPKPNAATRGWLTVSATDVKIPREDCQANYSPYCSLGMR
jgi:hypothetical protein